MRSKRFLLLSALLPIAAGAGTVAAIAADSAQAPHMRWQRPDFAKIRAQRADDIAMLVGLRPDQRAKLDAMMAAMEPPHREGGPGGGWGRGAPGSTPPAAPKADEGFLAHLDRMSQRIGAGDARAKQGIAAARAFYTSLDAGQKQRFDALERLRRTHGMGGGMGGRHDGHGGFHGMRGFGGAGGPSMAAPPTQG